jgi:hypothetical protein
MGVVVGETIVGGMIMIRSVFVYFENFSALPLHPRPIPKLCFYSIFTVNLTTNRLIDIHLIGI